MRRCGSAASIHSWRRDIFTSCREANSSGLRWRVPLVGSPRLLLLDEPFSNLDVDLRGELRGEFARLQRQAEADDDLRDARACRR